ncbi:hypothetical protein [Silvimonas sp.]|uniref:hypothetical protein n=1 Tax=Silvimonas sp. TaxID=2650811 RepID=UPI00284C32AF|nr:hypothetical protein [Silvimonas sp.]MDR3430231.1 hypothetical protein [Silvimonas sp.]
MKKAAVNVPVTEVATAPAKPAATPRRRPLSAKSETSASAAPAAKKAAATPVAKKVAAAPVAKKVAAAPVEVVVETSKKKKKPKVIRDSYTIPESDYAKLAELKKKSLELGIHVKKSELLRAGLHALEALPVARLKTLLGKIENIKTGRPAAEKPEALAKTDKTAAPKQPAK